MPGKQRIVISSFDHFGSTHYAGGGAAVVEQIARFLQPDYDVTVLTAARRRQVRTSLGVRYHYLPAAAAGPRAGQLLFHALLPRAARTIPHDLWIESFTPPFSTSFIPLHSSAPVAGLALNLSGQEMWGRYKIPFFLLERQGLRLYRHILVLNSADRDTVLRYSRSADVRLMPVSIDLPQIQDRQLGQGRYALFLGRIDIWHKGLDLLAEAYQRSGAPLPLLIAGNGRSQDEQVLRRLLSRSRADIRWLGRVSGAVKHDLLAGCAFSVMSSRHEAFGISALEAMAYGKPVVHFDIPALRWMDGDVRIQPFDVAALAEQVRALSDNGALRRDLGRTARAVALSYSAAEMARRYREFVQSVLGPAPA